MAASDNVFSILRPRVFRPVLTTLALILVGGLAWLALWMIELDQQIVTRMSSQQWALPARVFARPQELYPGKPLSRTDLLTELHWLGYSKGSQRTPGYYEILESSLSVSTRGFTFADGTEEPATIIITWDGDLIDSLSLAKAPAYALPGDETAIIRTEETGTALKLLRLEPLEIGAIHPDQHEDRILVAIDELPEDFVATLTAIEDKQFFRHHGVSIRGIVRAAWVNLRSGRKRQGASTLTQQLVKNLFLTNEKSWRRKVSEAGMAIAMDFRYPKETILEAFINEVFIAQDGNRAIHGFGLASEYFFARPLRELQPHQYALLIGMLKAPTTYNPVRRPEAAQQRRNLILRLMVEEGLLDEGDYAVAQSLALGVDVNYRSGGNPAYIDAVKRQLLTEYAPEDLQKDGLRIFTSFDPLVQAALEESVDVSMQAFADRYGGSEMPDDFLQVAAVVTDPNTGDIRAILGGRKSRFAGFNRALDAQRPVGSLLKPAIYLTALTQPERYTLASLIADEPVSLKQQNGSTWTPQNFDRKSRGKVTLLEALSRSMNLASVNLGLTLGLNDIIDTLESLGIDKPLPKVPSLLLGAQEFSAMEMTRMYQTIAADGFTIPTRTIRDVLDAANQSLKHFPTEVIRKFDDTSMYLLKFALTETMRIGTGRSAYNLLDRAFTVAGKTGTSNDQRDSWFAGYSGDNLAVIWLGNDNNATTPLTGSSGALRVWSELMQRISKKTVVLAPPAGIVYQATDMKTGRRVIARCKATLNLPFVEGSEPKRRTRCRQREKESWLRTLFSND